MSDEIDGRKIRTYSGDLKEIGNSVLKATGLGPVIDGIKQLRLGRVKPTAQLPTPNFDIKFEGDRDFRAKIIPPYEYFRNGSFPYTWGRRLELVNNQGIIFPYTPTITQDYSASYNSYTPTHSNYALHFYKSSTPGPITVAGKFSVQSDADAFVWLATTHLLRSLMKMRFGQDSNAGVPPPVCRFSALGDMQYKNVPVVIQNFRVDLPDSVDYYSTKSIEDEGSTIASGGTMVPVVSTITVTMLPMYSREELLDAKQVDDYIGATPNLRQKGYL